MPGPLSSALLRVRRVGVYLAHLDIRPLGHACSVWIVNDHVDRAYGHPAAGGAGTGWGSTAMPATESPSSAVPCESEEDFPPPEALWLPAARKRFACRRCRSPRFRR